MRRLISSIILFFLGSCSAIGQSEEPSINFVPSKFEPLNSISLNFRLDGKYEEMSMKIGLGVRDLNISEYTHFTFINLTDHKTGSLISVPEYHFSDIACFDFNQLRIDSAKALKGSEEKWDVELTAFVQKADDGLHIDCRAMKREGRQLPFLYILTINSEGEIESEYGELPKKLK